MKERTRNPRLPAAALLLLTLAAGLRLWYAWLNRFCANLDFPVVALAAKHMAEGKELPLFLYGQDYLGTLEPMAGALFCRLLGTSEFAVSLGTVLCSFFMLPVVWAWARDMGGRSAGLWALSLCAIGSPLLAGYSVISVGGYAVTLSVVPALLWLAARGASASGEKAHAGLYLVTGLLGGVGWWTFPLVLPALVAAALVTVFSGRITRLPLKAAAGLAGFAVGSAPFWLWNAANGWQTFTMSRSLGGGGWKVNAAAILTDRLPDVFGWKDFPAAASLLAMALLAAAFAWFLAAAFRTGAPRRYRAGAAAAGIYVILHTGILASSSYGGLNTSRYLLTLYPVAAVAAGTAAAAAGRRFTALGVLPLVLYFCLPQFRTPGDWLVRAGREKKIQEAARAVGSLLESKGSPASYISYHEYELNFTLRERFAFSEVDTDRYRPYFERAEREPAPAVIGNLGRIKSFLSYGGGSAAATSLPEPYKVAYHDFSPPGTGLATLNQKCILSVRDQDGREATALATGRDGTTAWRSGGTVNAFLEVELCRPVPLAAVRLWTADNDTQPGSWRVEGRAPEGGSWEVLASATEGTLWFWSGGRPYWGGETCRLTARFAPHLVDAVRIVGAGAKRPWTVASLDLLYHRKRAAAAAGDDGLQDIAEFAVARGIDAIYADRRESVVLHDLAKGRVTVPDHTGKGLPGMTLPLRIDLSAETALLVEEGEVRALRRLLADRHIAMEEKAFGPRTLFYAPRGWSAGWRDLAGLHWTGFGAVKRYRKRYAERLCRMAQTAGKDREALLREALASYGGHRTARELLQAPPPRGMTALASPVVFSPGFELSAATAGKVRVRPGMEFDVSLLWKGPPASNPWEYFSFLHFRRDGVAFQDDRILLGHLLEPEDWTFRPFDEAWPEKRTVRVPAGTAPGAYEVVTGLVHRGSVEPVAFRTGLPHGKKSATLPLRVEVVP